MSLEVPSENEILSNPTHRWPRVCINPDIWNQQRKIDDNPFSRWLSVKFEESNVNELDGVEGHEGLYMFVAKPKEMLTEHHSYILYVGETNNLKQRFRQYFRYRNSKNPSDQIKRRMVVVWRDYLYFYYITTNFHSKKEREKQEYDLVDTIVPPMNEQFRSSVLKNRLKQINS